MPIFDNKQQSWQWYIILSLLIFFSFYYAIGVYPLFDNNEGMYASIAKLMLLQKEFIIPHLNCVPYIEKPPLLYWLLSLSFSVFGNTAFAARFVTASSAALLSIAILYFTRKIKQSQVGIIGGLIFVSSFGISIIARMVFFDMLLTFFISSALFCLFYWYEAQQKLILRLGYLFLALAILTKGLVAIIIVGGVFGLFLILEKDFKKIYQALDPAGIALFLAITLPWHIAAMMQHKGFFGHYIVEEHFLRFLSKREPHDYYQGPIYYYLPRILIYIFPWSFFLPLLFWWEKNLEMSEKKLLRFGWCWLLVPLLFFSFSSAKANYYMIVSMPAVAFMLGIKLKNFSSEYPKIFKTWAVVVLGITTLMFGVGWAVFAKIPQVEAALNKQFFMMAIIYGVLATIIVIIMAKQVTVIADMIAAFIIPFVLVMVTYIQTVKADLSSADIGNFLSSQTNQESIYIYQDFEKFSALAFYGPGCFKIIDSQSNDLYYGAHLPQFKAWFVSAKEFLQQSLNQQTYVVVPADKLNQFYQNMGSTQFLLVTKNDRLAVVTH